MFEFILSNLKRGIEKITKNPQLVYTVVIAILITGSFVFMANRFISIANDAQERLVNVRIGSLQDAFVSFAKDKINEPDYLTQQIRDIMALNETITNFRVVVKKDFVSPEGDIFKNVYVVIASNNSEEINKLDTESSFIYNLAESQSKNSITAPYLEQGERIFKTSRSIIDDEGKVLGIVMTTQTLSLADLAIQKDIKNSRLILSVIIILILFLFFRHSKIIDYMDLYKRLKEIDQLKDDFISLASHELRTPLSLIRGYVSFAKENSENLSQTKDYLEKIDASAKGLDALVSDILDVSRIEQGRMQFNLESINPKTLIEEVINSFELSVKEKGLKIYFEYKDPEKKNFINIDIKGLKQVLVNIIGNAVKYTPKGEITVKQYIEKNKLLIRISDTGIGLTEEEKENLFQKFYRVKSEETERIRGTGLGLWITKEMIKKMNGKILVESIKGVGSHFIISFPLVK